ncbi:hypothetical protein EVAR_16265_1 [Eumeta japonica]|uniref:Uncharacterized protein n=1 Tax=Eumeta variegata TaxID=151549 RepID=A0A4C1U5T4_EUMVA|nr:hypothetical protein EVAR_16265_1 [Eumeta japonica]
MLSHRGKNESGMTKKMDECGGGAVKNLERGLMVFYRRRHLADEPHLPTIFSFRIGGVQTRGLYGGPFRFGACHRRCRRIADGFQRCDNNAETDDLTYSARCGAIVLYVKLKAQASFDEDERTKPKHLTSKSFHAAVNHLSPTVARDSGLAGRRTALRPPTRGRQSRTFFPIKYQFYEQPDLPITTLYC